MTLDTATDSKDLMSLYMDYIVQLRGDDLSIEDFCQYADIDSGLFYDSYPDVKSLEQDIWSFILSDAISTITQDPQYDSYVQNEQLLSFFYTFFESLTLNVEYFSSHLSMRSNFSEKREVLKGMKSNFNTYIEGTITNSAFSGLGIDQIDIVKDILQRSQKEGFWIQFICLIDFWKKDLSDGKEKTDIAIEKSVRAAIDLVEVAPVKSLLDLGRFIWQEKRGSN